MSLEFPFLLDVLSENVKSLKGKELFTFLGDKGNVVKGYTYEEFDQVTTKLASALLDPEGYGIKPGTNVLLCYPPGLDFIVAFVACLKAGVVAVPVYPPRPGFSKDLGMFVCVQADCGASVVLTNGQYNFARQANAFKEFITFSRMKWPDLKWIVTDDSKVPSSKSSYLDVRDTIDRNTLAFLQYTSGSTSAPKGVMVTHGNLAHNLSCIIHALEASNKTVVVSWLPQYHDMGLIGSYLGIIRCGGTGWYMSPISFIKNPVYWIEMCSKYRATHIQAPNFAYKLAVRKLKDSQTNPAKFDLSSLHHIFNAAEPLEVEVLDSFNRTFAQSKMQKSAMSPGYGLAEHTVYVSDRGEQRLLVDRKALEVERKVIVAISENDGDKSKTQWIVGCGNPHRFSDLSDIQVRIVNEKSNQVLEDDNVGEIWISSDSCAAGYYNKPEKTKTDFHAKVSSSHVSDEDLNRDWLRTGDLGFIHETELFICGRIKDLIIIRGRNHYPQDIEHTVEQTDEHLLRGGCVAAFTTADGDGKGEHLAIVAEVKDPKTPNLEDLSRKIRQKVSSQHGVMPFALVLIEPRTIPKTTSGKISRYRVKAAFKDGQLKQVHQFVGDTSREEGEDNEYKDVDFEEADRKNEESPSFVPIGATKDPKTGNLPSGDSLLENLREEIARLNEQDDASAVDPETSLIHLGMDSIKLIQFKQILEDTYNTHIEEMELFDEETNLQYIKRRVEGEPMAPKFSGQGGATAEEAQSASTTTNKKKNKKKAKKPSLFGCFKICGC